MLDEAQALAYAEADFAEPHDRFVALLREKLPGLPAAGRALDLGCGAGDIARRFARAMPGWQVHGIDGSPAMLRLAGLLTAQAGLDGRLSFARCLLPAAPPNEGRAGLVFSNSLLHHMANPDDFWSTVRDWAGPGVPVFVMDLLRPPSIERAAELVECYADGEPAVLRTDFFNSLCAAFELPEVTAQLARAGLDNLSAETVSDRHFIAWGRVASR